MAVTLCFESGSAVTLEELLEVLPGSKAAEEIADLKAQLEEAKAAVRVGCELTAGLMEQDIEKDKRIGELEEKLEHAEVAVPDDFTVAVAQDMADNMTRLRRFREALEKYGKHKNGCNSLYPADVDGDPGDMTCDCGFTEALG